MTGCCKWDKIKINQDKSIVIVVYNTLNLSKKMLSDINSLFALTVKVVFLSMAFSIFLMMCVNSFKLFENGEFDGRFEQGSVIRKRFEPFCGEHFMNLDSTIICVQHSTYNLIKAGH